MQSEARRFEVLHRVFERQVDRSPDAVAVRFGAVSCRYAELEERANRIARALQRRGVGRGSLAALMAPRSVDLYAALLGILKAGAAYVPIDPSTPPARVEQVLAAAGAQAVVTTAEALSAAGGFDGVAIRLDADRSLIAEERPTRPSPGEVGVGPRDLCYVIFTSGSTGSPKGVMIEHRSAVHLVCAEARIFGVGPGDRVYQGLSLAFDASVEELWLAFRAGATLVPATPEMERAGPDLGGLLAREDVTVLSCVPTLLAMVEGDVPSLRLLILGGEACPEGLVHRWARPGRRIVNTYGPTEATVIATYADLAPGREVVIGRPLPGYVVELLDSGQHLVPPGEVGEIVIGGVGLARGYLGLPEETRARFVPDPFHDGVNPGGRLYLTGDLGRWNSDGDLEFHGRADGQVKIRGYRVELAEIETALMGAGACQAAACALREDATGLAQLIAWVVPGGGRPIDEEGLRASLRRTLPAYMVPARIETLDALPVLPSGKLDRAALPAPRASAGPPQSQGRSPRTATERRLLGIWAALFPDQPVGLEDDFFVALGGHSLLAARMVSQLRKDPRYRSVSLGQVYEHPTVASLAAAIDGGSAEPPRSAPAERVAAGRGRPRARAPGPPFFFGPLQAVGLYLVFGLRALQSLLPFLVFFALTLGGLAVLPALGWAALSAALALPAFILLTALVKWLVLGKVRPGRHPLFGGYYLRWWLVQTLVGGLHLSVLSGTPLLPLIYRLFGVHVGRRTEIGTDHLAAFDLIAIGDDASVDTDASLLGYAVEGGELVLGPVTVGRGGYVGTRSVLGVGAALGDGARLEDLSLLPPGARVPAGETWWGSPARPWPEAPPAPPPAPPLGGLQRGAASAAYVALIAALPVVTLLPFLPGVAWLMRLDPLTQPLLFLASAPLVGASFVLLSTTLVVLLKRLLVGRVPAGRYPVHGRFYVRYWAVDRLMAFARSVMGPLHATLWVAPFYRALGARIGRRVELSTATDVVPDLLDIVDGGTVADEASLGAARVERGWLLLAPVHIGRRAFVGNSGVLPGGTRLGDGSLVGVLSISPAGDRAGAPGAGWLGSPPIELRRRERSAAFTDSRTYDPPRRLVLARGAFELLRVTLPPAGFLVAAVAALSATLELWIRLGPMTAMLLLPLVHAAACGAVLIAVLGAKWLIVGRYRPFVWPLWSFAVWRLELVNALYEFLATPLALEALEGTPLLPFYLRRLGARIGRRAYLQTTGFLEWDLVEIGDDVAMNDGSIAQTHLFEDRILKASRLRIGTGGTVGAWSVVLYDSEMEDGARLDALSLLMKGERLPCGTAWTGIPAARSVSSGRAGPPALGAEPGLGLLEAPRAMPTLP